jgi:AcrR family transcriptional regulator
MSAPTTPSPAEPDPRAAILDAARSIGDELGEDALTMRSIAGRAGTNPTMLYKYFDSKAVLLAALKQHARAKLEREIAEILAERDDDPREQLCRICMAHVRSALLCPWLYAIAFGKVLLDVTHVEPMPGDVLIDRASACLAATGALPAHIDARMAAVQLRIAIHGLTSALRERDRSKPRDRLDPSELLFAEGYVRMLLVGLLTRSSRETAAWASTPMAIHDHAP